MKRKIILSGIVGALLSGCLGEGVSPKSLSLDGLGVPRTKKTSTLYIHTVDKNGGELCDIKFSGTSLEPFNYQDRSELASGLFSQDLEAHGMGGASILTDPPERVLRLTNSQSAKFSKSDNLFKDGKSVFAGFALKDQSSLDISFGKDKTVMSAFLVSEGKSDTERVELKIGGGVNFLTKGGSVLNTNVNVTNGIFTVSGSSSTVPEGWVFGSLVLGSDTLLKTNSDIVIEDKGYLGLRSKSAKIQSTGNILVKSGKFQISRGDVRCKELINDGYFGMDSNQFEGGITNRKLVRIFGGEVKGAIDNQGTFKLFGGKHIGTFTNQKSGIIEVMGGTLGDIKNFGTIDLQLRDNVTAGNITCEEKSTFQGSPGQTLTTKSLTLSKDTAFNVTLYTGGDKDPSKAMPMIVGDTIALNNAQMKLTAPYGGLTSKGTIFVLAKANTTLDGTVILSELVGKLTDGTSLETKHFKLETKDKLLTLTALEDLDIAQATSPQSSSHHHIGGHFRKPPKGILKDPNKKHGHKKKVHFKDVALLFSGDDLNLSNLNTRGTELNVTVGSATFSADFVKNNQAFDGTFGLLNVKDFDGFTLTNSLEFTSKSGLEGDHVASQFNDTSFMSAISKNLVSGDFTLTPSIAVGYSRLSDFSASVDNFNVSAAQASAYVADFSVDAVQSFKLAGLEIQANAGINFGVKSAQNFELKNAFGETMNGTTANKNVGLSFGFTAKLDSKTSFYATAQTESYNNSKKMEFGVKF